MRNCYMGRTLFSPALFMIILSSLNFPQTCQSGLWGTNDTVKAIYIDEPNGIIYLGGNFNYTGPYTGASALTNILSVKPDTLFPKIAGEIYSSVSDGVGGWFIAGDFTISEDFDIHNLAHIKADCSIDTLFMPEPDDDVNSIIIHGNKLYAAGKFKNIGGVSRTGIAAINTVNGNIYAWNPVIVYTTSSAPSLYSLASQNSYIYVGGRFNSVSDSSRKNIAKIDTSVSAFSPYWNPRPSSYVRTITVSGKSVYMGGDFTNLNGIGRKRAASVDTGTGAMLNAWNPSADGPVYTLCMSDNLILAGGAFHNIGGTDKSFAALMDTSAGTALEWEVNPDSTVRIIKPASGSSFYMGGEFHNINATPRNHLALVTVAGELSEWTFNTSHAVLTISSLGSMLLTGGLFNSAGGIVRNHLLSMNAASGEITGWDPAPNGEIRTIASINNTIFAGGSFTRIAGENRDNIAAIDKSTGSALNWNPGADETVNTIQIFNNTLYAGGRFAYIGTSARNHLAAINISDASILGWNPDVNGYVNSIACSDSIICIGGNFSYAGGEPRLNLAAVYTLPKDGTDGKICAWNPGCNAEVKCILVNGSLLYAGGSGFTAAGGENRNNLAAISLTSGLATGWNPAPNNTVNSISVCESTLYVGGNFISIGGKTRRRIAAVSLEETGSVSLFNPNCDGEVSALIASTGMGMVYAGGIFSKAAGSYHYSFAAMDDPYNISLPVELDLFTADISDRTITFKWRTQTEINSFKFEIQKCPNRHFIRYSTLAELKACGNCLSPRTYSYAYSESQPGRYYYRLKMTDLDGSFSFSNILELYFDAPSRYALLQNYPNPFNPSTTIEYELPDAAFIELIVFDILGREIKTLAKEFQTPGRYNLKFTIENSELPSGLYFCRLSARNSNNKKLFTGTKKIIFLK